MRHKDRKDVNLHRVGIVDVRSDYDGIRRPTHGEDDENDEQSTGQLHGFAVLSAHGWDYDLPLSPQCSHSSLALPDVKEDLQVADGYENNRESHADRREDHGV